ncbi:MAG: hypothetical protein H7A25_16210 [Leptospiraceae bacterium]|nr:hypothetical protein [Leptospiraceae bacterium]MCP5501446.1 hypothetical protein [Leptospiraceae bacterium]
MKIISIIIYMFILIISLGAEENAAKEKEKSGNHLDIIAYSGLYTETDLLPILFQQKTNYKASRISVLGLNYGLSSNIRFFDFEAEGQLVKHSGLMNHLEMNVFLLARWSNLFRLPVSIAFGEGISLASKNPLLENKKKGIYIYGNYFDWYEASFISHQFGSLPFNTEFQLDSIRSSQVLNYLMVELDFAFEFLEYYPRIFMRIHHRSGVFGLYCKPDPACGSNFISYGVKFRL